MHAPAPASTVPEVLLWTASHKQQRISKAGSDTVTEVGLTPSPSWKPLTVLPSSRRLLRFPSNLQGEGACWQGGHPEPPRQGQPQALLPKREDQSQAESLCLSSFTATPLTS